MHDLVIADTAIRQDAQGRYCLNDLHRAAGGEKRHGPSYWLESTQTRALVDEMSDTGNPVSVQRGGAGQQQGTFVAKELVYAYAMWISPAFHLKVIRAYDAATAPPVDPMLMLNDPAVMRGLLLSYAERTVALEHRVDELAPKAEALDRFATFSDGSMCVSNAAKALQVQPTVLFRWLQQNEWIFRRAGGSSWLAYQARIQAGYLEHKVTTVERGDGSQKVVEQVLVTAKGIAKLAAQLSTGAA